MFWWWKNIKLVKKILNNLKEWINDLKILLIKKKESTSTRTFILKKKQRKVHFVWNKIEWLEFI
jgi:hypothetical protein